MGWTYFHKPKGIKAVDAIKSSVGADWWAERVVASTATREAVFLAVRSKHPSPDDPVYVPDADGHVTALEVFKIGLAPRDHYNFGYKDMSETCGPYGCEAPLSILAKCSELRDPIGPLPEYSGLGSAREYRARSVKLAERKATKRGLKPGDTVELPEPLSFGGIKVKTFIVDHARVRGRKGVSTVFRAPNGMLCNLTARHLDGATIIAKGA